MPGEGARQRAGARVRAWPAAGRASAAATAAAERATLARGIRYRTVFLVLVGTILVVAAVNVLFGTIGLLRETRARPLTVGERAEYVKADVARRWHAWPATVVFPDELEYIGIARTQQHARRVGIAPETSCAGGLDTPIGSILGANGCRTLLRATYVDQTSSFAITVGVAVFASEEDRVQAAAQLPADDRIGVRPVSFPGTATELFGAAQRQRNGWVGAGPYLVFSTAGYSDGRTREAVPPEEILHSELWPTAQSVAGRIARSLGEPPAVPRCTQGNVC
ncbi:hypothetical protein [Spongiactinospora sp. TRM90649]|uniref:hypothetical protein n=1 Tax=Spongiactinospora sp. TRM90649 TaxID=3031114 RepID=UPI0023F61B11|nr:hypothetical protein [Spongiactinospora sp. TRM90649]MDF5755511.1 hypothetical protein [Spongiactinospora sp. TRM90649]